MANKSENNDAKPSGVLVTAATSIGKVAGKIVGMVRKKAAGEVATTPRGRTRKKVQTSARKTVARKKTGISRKTDGTRKPSSRGRKSPKTGPEGNHAQ